MNVFDKASLLYGGCGAMKSETLLKMFTTYCMEHPEEGFWRALCKWSGYSVLISPLPGGGQTLDTSAPGEFNQK